VIGAGAVLQPALARAQVPVLVQPARPRIEVAAGMGASFDDAGLVSGLAAVPAFFVMGGFGDGMIGFDLGLFTNSATGRFRTPNVPVDRLALDGMFVLRPGADRSFARAADWAGAYGARIVRAAAVDLGVGYERASRVTSGPQSVDRFGFRIGAHLDVPLTPANATSELRLRLAVRRFVGMSHVTFPNGDPAPDTRAEVFAALAAVF
jgi:hypothetical protein